MQENYPSRRKILKYGLSTLGLAATLPATVLLEACTAQPTTAPAVVGTTSVAGTPAQTGAAGTATTAAAAGATTAAAAGGKTITLKLNSSMPTGPNSSHWVWYDKFQQLLQTKTGGQIKITVFPNNQLGKEADIVQQVKLGAVDMMITGSSIWSTVVPDLSVLDMGYIFESLDTIGKVMDGNAGQMLNKLIADQANIEVLGWCYNFGARNVCTKNPVKKPEDLKGMKIRVLPVVNFTETLKLMGAVATPIDVGEVYTALQTGVVDGVEHDAPSILGYKWFEIAKNLTLTQHIYNPLITVISKSSLAKIPASLQPAFMEAAKEATLYQRGQAADTEKKAFETLKQSGVTVYPIDRQVFRKDVQPLWSKFTTEHPASKPILDAIRAAQG